MPIGLHRVRRRLGSGDRNSGINGCGHPADKSRPRWTSLLGGLIGEVEENGFGVAGRDLNIARQDPVMTVAR